MKKTFEVIMGADVPKPSITMLAAAPKDAPRQPKFGFTFLKSGNGPAVSERALRRGGIATFLKKNRGNIYKTFRKIPLNFESDNNLSK